MNFQDITTFSTAHQNPYFLAALDKVKNEEQASMGIGTFKEKTIHAVLKNFYAPQPDNQEIKVAGYVADILLENQIIEIQSRHFHLLRKKLEAFLPLYDVTIVYPIPQLKWVSWINEETGEVSQKRKSPKRGTLYQILPELYKLKAYLGHPRLHFILTFLEVEEYRLLNGWSHDKKRGSSRYDGFPIRLIGEIHLSDLEDYKQFLPNELPDVFTSKDYACHTKLRANAAGIGLNVLYTLGLIERVGKKGNAFLYTLKYK